MSESSVASVDANTARDTALETLVELTRSVDSRANRILPPEVRLSAAIELLNYARREEGNKNSALGQPRRRHRDE